MSKRIFTKDEIKNRISPVLSSYGVKRAVLFGSYSKGSATSESDVDLVVDSGLKGLRFVGLMDDIRGALNDKDVDVFDVSHIEPGSKVELEIKKTGTEIYAK